MARFYQPDLAQVLGNAAPAAGPAAGDEAWQPLEQPAAVALEADQAHHARRVLRLQEGQAIELFDGQGLLARGSWRGGQILVEQLARAAPLWPAIDVAAALPKGGHSDDMVVALSQVGARALIPLTSQRSVVEARPGKLLRLERLVVESAKQCRRAHLLQIAPAVTLPVLLQQPYNLRLLASPRGQAMEQLPRQLASAAAILILIGPEGGWSDQEQRLCQEQGCLPWRLGPHVLRIETAAVVAAAVARYLSPSPA